MKSRSVLFFLLFVLALGACGEGDPVSSRQPAGNSGTVAKRISSSLTISAPAAGLAESRMSGADTAGTDSTDLIANPDTAGTDSTDVIANPDTAGTDSTGVITANPDSSVADIDPGRSGTLVFLRNRGCDRGMGCGCFRVERCGDCR